MRAINPVRSHLLQASLGNACGNGTTAGPGPASEIPIRLGNFGYDYFQKSEGPVWDTVGYLVWAAAIKDKNHEPDILGVMSLPATEMPGCFNFDAVVTM